MTTIILNFLHMADSRSMARTEVAEFNGRLVGVSQFIKALELKGAIIGEQLQFSMPNGDQIHQVHFTNGKDKDKFQLEYKLMLNGKVKTKLSKENKLGKYIEVDDESETSDGEEDYDR